MSDYSCLLADNEKAHKQVRNYRATYWEQCQLDKDASRLLSENAPLTSVIK
jgi:hypothetical protein